jgi:hypothetical protein
MITGTGDHLRPEWPITITGMRRQQIDGADRIVVEVDHMALRDRA